MADKGTFGTGLWPSCLLSHSGREEVSLSVTLTVFLLCSAHGRPVCSPLLKATDTVDVSLIHVLSCVGPKSTTHSSTHTLKQCYHRKQPEWEWTLIRGVIFSILICYWALLLSFCLLFELDFLLFSFPFNSFSLSLTLRCSHFNSCVSLPQSFVLLLSTVLFVRVDMQRYSGISCLVW